MSKRVNFVNLNEKSLQALSAWNQAVHALQVEKAAYKAEVATCEALKSDVMRARSEAESKGLSIAEVDKLDGMSLQPYNDRITAAKSKLDDARKDCRQAETACMEKLGLWLCDSKGKVTAVPVGSAYANFVARGNFDGLVKATKPALDALQAGNVDTNTAGKFAKYCLQVAKRNGASASDTANGHFVATYAKLATQKSFAVAFTRGILEYLVNVAKVVTVNEDGSLARKVYDANSNNQPAKAESKVA